MENAAAGGAAGNAGAPARAKPRETLLLRSRGGDAFPAHSSRTLPIPLHWVVKQQVCLCRCGQLAIRADKRLWPWSRSCERRCWAQTEPAARQGAGEGSGRTVGTAPKSTRDGLRHAHYVQKASPMHPRARFGLLCLTPRLANLPGELQGSLQPVPTVMSRASPPPEPATASARSQKAQQAPQRASPPRRASPTLLQLPGRAQSNRCLGRTQEQHRPPRAAPGASCSTRPHARSNDCKGRVIAVV